MAAAKFEDSHSVSWCRARRRSAVALGAATLLVLVAGCGDDKNDSGGTTAAAPSSGDVVEADISEFKIVLSASEVTSGSITINANNKGTIEHELVIIKTDLDISALPVVDGLVPEADVDVVDEIAEFAAGTTASGTFELAPGKYVLICNIPAHYAQGMHAALNVKG